jgi:hypothetical protein
MSDGSNLFIKLCSIHCLAIVNHLCTLLPPGLLRPSQPLVIVSSRLSKFGLRLECRNQSSSGAIVVLGVSGLIQLGQNLLGKALTKFHSPLVEGVDVPDGTLGEGKVLVERDQRTKSTWRNLLREDRGGRSVAQEGLVLVQCLRGSLGLELLLALADHEGFGLRKEVACQHLLVLVVIDWVVALGSNDEVGWDQLGALVQQLIEGVLGISSGLAEEDWAGGVFNHVTIAGDSLAVGLHG